MTRFVGAYLMSGFLRLLLEHVDKIFERSREIVNTNKAVIDKWLDGHKYLRQYAEAYGTTYLIHYDLETDAETFCNGLLDEKGVLVCHGDCFYMAAYFQNDSFTRGRP